ncbi:MAG: coproporphyrinogen dehydrogenase HemZ, partial [Lachnospiraceae bacterium]|nr:coproporphyrinogen dehydrogenase HemZ [Lachnospiraceae bacterium]
MIKIYTNLENYQYDLHALFKAFYPEQEVQVYGEGALNEQENDSRRVIIHFYERRIEAVFDIDGKKKYTNIYKDDTNVTKIKQKLSVYEDLCDYTGRTLPWGGLTGIRPTKLSMGMLSEG